uniref:Uncharacterized protein AlNc14C101G6031 n=1 Tax=Albugo laibachii Nc14 TaxID=890382 RepID=F0WHG8_9STRA|nr:conserved hypothetical protein [Albugo laibachii Nc14]|eukprot:CCA20687.1 conserved hypothetical protein [Albugo laibachii Nc14]
MALDPLECTVTWDPIAVIAHAKETILRSNYVEVQEARVTVDNVLNQWVTLVSQYTKSSNQTSQLLHSAVQKIITLWVSYANLEIELRQFKQTTKVLEAAVNCPIAGASATTWTSFAEFYVERKKFASASKVFTRALTSGLPQNEQNIIYERFLSFLKTNVDPSMTMETLKAQILPTTASNPADSAPTTNASTLTKANEENPASPDSEKPSALVETMKRVDPAIAFVDTTGDVAVDKLNAKRERQVEPSQSSWKRPCLSSDIGEKNYFHSAPISLPCIPKCPNLLFDQWNEGETQSDVDTSIVEQLSEILKDTTVFQRVKELGTLQRKRDREMLYRWQDLIGTQMKEGTDLFTKHMEAEQGVVEPREVIALKTTHLEQRREFVERCQASQQMFIEICEMDRLHALEAQQNALKALRIPKMEVSSDLELVMLQRAIVALILETEQLWRQEVVEVKKPAVDVEKPGSFPSGRNSSRRDRRRDNQDSHNARGRAHGGSRGRHARRNGGGKSARSSSPFGRSRQRRENRDGSFARTTSQHAQPASFTRPQHPGFPPLTSDSFRAPFDVSQRGEPYQANFGSETGAFYSNTGAPAYNMPFENTAANFAGHRGAQNGRGRGGVRSGYRANSYAPSDQAPFREAFEYPRANNSMPNTEHAFRYQENLGNASFQNGAHPYPLQYAGAGNPTHAVLNGPIAYRQGHGSDSTGEAQHHPYQMKPTSTFRQNGSRRGAGGRGRYTGRR